MDNGEYPGGPRVARDPRAVPAYPLHCLPHDVRVRLAKELDIDSPLMETSFMTFAQFLGFSYPDSHYIQHLARGAGRSPTQDILLELQQSGGTTALVQQALERMQVAAANIIPEAMTRIHAEYMREYGGRPGETGTEISHCSCVQCAARATPLGTPSNPGLGSHAHGAALDMSSGHPSLLERSWNIPIYQRAMPRQSSTDLNGHPLQFSRQGSGDSNGHPRQFSRQSSGDSNGLPRQLSRQSSGDSNGHPLQFSRQSSGDSNGHPGRISRQSSGDSNGLSRQISRDSNTTQLFQQSQDDARTDPLYGNIDNIVYQVARQNPEGLHSLDPRYRLATNISDRQNQNGGNGAPAMSCSLFPEATHFHRRTRREIDVEEGVGYLRDCYCCQGHGCADETYVKSSMPREVNVCDQCKVTCAGRWRNLGEQSDSESQATYVKTPDVWDPCCQSCQLEGSGMSAKGVDVRVDHPALGERHSWPPTHPVNRSPGRYFQRSESLDSLQRHRDSLFDIANRLQQGCSVSGDAGVVGNISRPPNCANSEDQSRLLHSRMRVGSSSDSRLYVSQEMAPICSRSGSVNLDPGSEAEGQRSEAPKGQVGPPAERKRTVLVTYSNHNKSHVREVIQAARGLKAGGVGIQIDLDDASFRERRINKIDWLDTSYQNADYIVVCLSPTYFSEVQPPDNSTDGARPSESLLNARYIFDKIRQEYYDNKSQNYRIIPVLFPQSGASYSSHVPHCMSSTKVYTYPDCLEDVKQLVLGPES